MKKIHVDRWYRGGYIKSTLLSTNEGEGSKIGKILSTGYVDVPIHIKYDGAHPITIDPSIAKLGYGDFLSRIIINVLSEK